MTDELIPCPFCGEECIGISPMEAKDERRYFQRQIECSNCECAISAYINWSEYRELGIDGASNKLAEMVTNKWNRRYNDREIE